MSSSEMLTSPEVAEPKLEQIINRFRSSEYGNLSVFPYFGLDGTPGAADIRSAQKDQFLAGEIENPRLNYPKLEARDTGAFLTEAEHDILDLMNESVRLDYNSDREIALYDILKYRLLQIYLLQISRKLATEDVDDEERAKLVDLFNTANDEIYGVVEPGIFYGIMGSNLRRAEQLAVDESAPPEVREASRYLLEHISPKPNDIEAKPPVEIATPTIVALKPVIEQTFADLIALVPEKDEPFSIEQLADFFRQAHEIRHTGWDVELVKGKNSVDTRQREKITVIGTERKQPTTQEAVDVLLHENGVHVTRRQLGDETEDPLLGGMGLAGYDDIEEGLATKPGQILKGKQGESGRQYYGAIGLAKGVDGTPRNFRAVYEIEWRRQFIQEYEKKKTPITEERATELRQKAYTVCERIFRGTLCDEPGMCYSKDLAYYVGDQGAWQVLSGLVDLPLEEQRKLFDVLLVGKYNPLNGLHRRLVETALNNMEQAT